MVLNDSEPQLRRHCEALQRNCCERSASPAVQSSNSQLSAFSVLTMPEALRPDLGVGFPVMASGSATMIDKAGMS